MGDPGICDEDVGRPAADRQPVRHRIDGSAVADVDQVGLDHVSFGCKRGPAGFAALRADVGQHDRRARFAKRFGAGKADPLPGSRHHRHAAGKIEFPQVHIIPFWPGTAGPSFPPQPCWI